MLQVPSPSKTLSFIGCGQLGQTLGYLWHAHRVFNIQQVLNRSSSSAAQAIHVIGAGEPAGSYADLRPADIYLIGTPDDKIPEAAGQLAASSCLLPGTIVLHCSGALSSTALQQLEDKGAHVASIHPIKSFASVQQAAGTFAGTWCGIEGQRQALHILRPAFEAIGARCADIRTEDKLIYHAAAVFASNYLVTLLDAALQAYTKSGIPEATAREMLYPLVQGTLANVMQAGTEKALTGPVARGDCDTVRHQHQALSAWDRNSARMYKQMALHTARLAARRK